MRRTSTKAAAEGILRELPSVHGALVREDVRGHPREIHVLIGPGPSPRNLALDIRDLLEEHLDIPIDQRVISIAQLRPEDDEPAVPAPPRPDTAASRRTPRVVFAGLEAAVSGARTRVQVRLRWRDDIVEGESHGLESAAGRGRAAASATLRAADRIAGDDATFQLETASMVRALDRDYALVSALIRSPRLGRRPVPVVGAHPVESDLESAAALAALKAINRLLGFVLSTAGR